MNSNIHGKYAIVLTHNRPELLELCVAAIGPQVDLTIIIDNASDPPVMNTFKPNPSIVVRDSEQPPNLSRLWNVGMNSVALHAEVSDEQTWDIAFLCDDALVPAGWFDIVATGMREHDATVASTHCANPVSAPILKTAPDGDVWNRMCPWAFIMRGERSFPADEDLKWWWGDTYVDFTARENGGMVIVPGPVVVNQKMNEFTATYPGLMQQSGDDGNTFARKYGGRPW